YGFTSAPPASVGGARLPYTAEGHQLVLLRYTDESGWQIADVPRNADGSAFPLLPAADVGSNGNAVFVAGAMLPSGEAWLLVTEKPAGGSGRSPVVALFHRVPGGQFTLDPDLDPNSPSYDSALATMLTTNLGTAQMHLGVGS